MKGADSNSSVMESSEESSVERKTVKKYCILRGKYNHSIEKYKDLRAINNKELNAPIEKKFHRFVKNKTRRKAEKELQYLQISDDESKKSQACPKA